MKEKCLNCGLTYTDENDPCYGHEDATPDWPTFHTPTEPQASAQPTGTEGCPCGGFKPPF